MIARISSRRNVDNRLGGRSSRATRVRAAQQTSGFEALEPRQMLDGSLPDDRFEDNDTRAVVVAQPEGGTNSPNLGVVSGQRTINQLALVDVQDVYRIRLVAAGGPENFARINFTAVNGNLDLRLLGSGGRILRTSLGDGPVERISFDGLNEGVYFLRVNGKNGAMNARYRMTINAPAAPGPNEDRYEQNDTLAQVAARTVGTNSPNLGNLTNTTISGLKLADTIDIFSFTTTTAAGAGSFVRINTSEPLNMVLFNGNGQSVRSSEAYQGVFQMNLAGLAPGQYFVQVTHYALDAVGSFAYSLQFQA